MAKKLSTSAKTFYKSYSDSDQRAYCKINIQLERNKKPNIESNY